MSEISSGGGEGSLTVSYADVNYLVHLGRIMRAAKLREASLGMRCASGRSEAVIRRDPAVRLPNATFVYLYLFERLLR